MAYWVIIFHSKWRLSFECGWLKIGYENPIEQFEAFCTIRKKTHDDNLMHLLGIIAIGNLLFAYSLTRCALSSSWTYATYRKCLNLCHIRSRSCNLPICRNYGSTAELIRALAARNPFRPGNIIAQPLFAQVHDLRDGWGFIYLFIINTAFFSSFNFMQCNEIHLS